LWMAGVVLVMGREVLSQLRGEWLRRRSRLTSAGYALSPDLAVPAVCGLLWPTVLLPEEAVNWDPARVEAVLAHERMHVMRGDLWWQLLGRVACAVYWMNPLVWLAARAQRVECEQACDDGVVVAGVAATDYAGHLVEIARGLNNELILEGGLSMAKQSTLEQRLRALLDPMTSHRPLSRGMLVTSALLSVALLAPVAGLKLIAQTPGGVRGVVKDASGANVAGARVTLRFLKPSANQRVEIAKTNGAGEFSFPSLPDDDSYAIFVEKEGFAVLSNTMVKVGAPLVFTLNLGGLRETVTVNGGAMPPPPPPPPPPPGTPQAVSPTRIRIGGNVQAAKLVNKVNPIYPADCKKEGISGVVLLSAVIGKEGDVLSLEPVNQFVDARLRESAMNAVKLWRYQPTLLNGNPVEVTTQVEVNFTLAP
jgi:TonB family protein